MTCARTRISRSVTIGGMDRRCEGKGGCKVPVSYLWLLDGEPTKLCGTHRQLLERRGHTVELIRPLVEDD
jgi:hypothetical protein